MLKRFLRAWVLEPTRAVSADHGGVLRAAVFPALLGLDPVVAAVDGGVLAVLPAGGPPLAAAAARGLALFFGAMALVNTGIAFYYA